jgi:phage/plasmid-like protein (TIGR03299 family)
VDALDWAGLNWEVRKEQVFTASGAPIPRAMATVRSDTGAPLGIVSPMYRPYQNRELAEFGEAIQDAPDVHIDTAGQALGGRIVYLSFKIDRDIHVPGDDGAVLPYLLLVNGHDGRHVLTAAITPIRAVCLNTVRLALANAVSQWRLRHTSGLEGRIAAAREALGLTFEYLNGYAAEAERLLKVRVPRTVGQAALLTAFPVPKDATDEEVDRSLAARIAEVWEDSETLANVRWTGWGLLNAVAEYLDHYREYRGGSAVSAEDRRFLRAVLSEETLVPDPIGGRRLVTPVEAVRRVIDAIP